MAITSAELNTALGRDGLTQKEQVLRQLPPYGGTLQYWLINGNRPYHGRVAMLSTTASDNAATQATAIFTALNAIK